MTMVNPVTRWLTDIYNCMESNYDSIKSIKFHMNNEMFPCYELDCKEDNAFHNNYYKFLSNFRFKPLTKVEFFFDNGSTKEFLPPNE